MHELHGNTIFQRLHENCHNICPKFSRRACSPHQFHSCPHIQQNVKQLSICQIIKIHYYHNPLHVKKMGAFFTLQSHKHELNFGCQCLRLHFYLLKSIKFLHNNIYGPQNNHVLCHSSMFQPMESYNVCEGNSPL